MRFAQVGAFKRRSEADVGRQATAVLWLTRHARGYVKEMGAGVDHDVINLRYGRDFLRERGHYDVVVVHSVMDPKWFGEPGTWAAAKPSARRDFSAVGSYARWRARLVETDARYIFVFEGLPVCLSGWNLGPLPGYIIRYRDTLFTVYERKG